MIILYIGYYASKKESGDQTSQGLLLAGRRMPAWIGIFTMTATWVGGGYIIGTSEAVYDSARGLVWAQAPWGYALSLILGGLFFAKKIRSFGYTTFIDVFEHKYGKKTAAILFIPALIGEVFWSAAILAALGITFATIFELDLETSILVSASIAIGYTMMGGLWSVAYTDVVQLIFIIVGLGISIPFALDKIGGIEAALNIYDQQFTNGFNLFPSLSAFSGTDPAWGNSIWVWLDFALLLIMGGIPWQVYFQRVLSSNSDKSAIRLSIFGGICCALMAIPAIFIGVAGVGFDWSQSSLGVAPEATMVLPYVLLEMTPPIIAALGLGAVAAAVMSSVDSSILSAASMFTWNFYRPLLKPSCSDKQIKNSIRLAILGIGLISTWLALTLQSVYELWYLCADLVYVVLFPQLVMALYFKKANKRGAIAGIIVGIFLRFGGGEPIFSIPPFIPYPMEDPIDGIQFPFRTFSMICSLISILIVSLLFPIKKTN
ncbi:sodium:solute symporter family protein [Cyclobacterium marinum]|uniref:Na+/solute symporter n=1 Tax=Cyclobacterium marinum (strain ATCC 25205 / DSM 745 / LMG 13164 / NCIMB 1802) TaxID=880070 RepID=G0J6M2_CYCMS|nr:sodium:solute symporter family protein [Cyclobacterium marinum]AEL28537.1 Na+/solute symporter [Cyclobacterium marinum DSM 745]